VNEKYEFIDGEKDNFPLARMCAWAGVSRSGLYHWRARPASATNQRRADLKLIIRQVFDDSDETYGYRRVHAQLARLDVRVGPELVRALMRELGLVPCQPHPWRLTTVSDAAVPATPDLVARDFTADAPGRKLVGDITYVATWQGFLYLATVIDCHTKAVIGWATADHMKTTLISDAIDMNIAVVHPRRRSTAARTRGALGAGRRADADFFGVDVDALDTHPGCREQQPGPT
jgi:transposase InsO family protein